MSSNFRWHHRDLSLSLLIYTHPRWCRQSCGPEKLHNTKEHAAVAVYACGASHSAAWGPTAKKHSGKTLTYRRFAAWSLECVFPASSPSNSTSYSQFSAAEAAAAAGTTSLWKYPIWPLSEWMSMLQLLLHPANRRLQAASDRDSPINCVMLWALI